MKLEVDWDKIMDIHPKMCRWLFGQLVKKLRHDLSAEVNLRKLVASGVDRSLLWRSFAWLAKHGYIRRPASANNWSIVYLNPEIIRPTHLFGPRLERAIESFKNGQEEALKERNTRKKDKEEIHELD